MELTAISKLGGDEHVLEVLREAGHTRIGKRGVKGWRERGQIPGYAILAMQRWAIDHNIELLPEDFVRRDAA